MKIINSKYFQKWYNTVDDALKEKAFNIINEHRTRLLDSLKTYKKGKKKAADDFRKALEYIPASNFGMTLSDEEIEKLDIILDIMYHPDNKPSIFQLANYGEIVDITWELQRELHRLMEFDIKEVIDLSNSDKGIDEEIDAAAGEIEVLINRTICSIGDETSMTLTSIGDEVFQLTSIYDGCYPTEYDADTFRKLDLLLNLPKHIADDDFIGEETLWQGWRDITGQLKRVIDSRSSKKF